MSELLHQKQNILNQSVLGFLCVCEPISVGVFRWLKIFHIQQITDGITTDRTTIRSVIDMVCKPKSVRILCECFTVDRESETLRLCV